VLIVWVLSWLLSRDSCLVTRVSWLLSHDSWLVTRVSWLLSRDSCLVSRVSCLVTRVSWLESHDSCLESRVVSKVPVGASRAEWNFKRLRMRDAINALAFPLQRQTCRLLSASASLYSSDRTHCRRCCWCCWLPSDCTHGTGCHRHGDGPRERDPQRGKGRKEGTEIHQFLCRRWGWMVMLYRGVGGTTV